MGQQGQNGGARFAVGFSYAGEDSALVAPLAEELARCCGRQRVLFDRFHEAELARPDLDVYLPRLYRDETELIVVLLSSDYPNKRWCGLEWRWIRQLIVGPPKSGSCCCGWAIRATSPSWVSWPVMATST